MNPRIRDAFDAAMGQARAARARGDLALAFAALERAHILGQRHLLPHLATHWLMLVIALQRRDSREFLGQLLRLAASFPAWLTGWVPKGNTGGADVPALRPMPLDRDLAELLADYDVRHDVSRRAVLLALLVVTALAIASSLQG